MKSKFKIGDKVKIVNYGHLMWVSKSNTERLANITMPKVYEDDTFEYFDMAPELVGQKRVVRDISLCQGRFDYALCNEDGSGYIAWLSEKQLELIE